MKHPFSRRSIVDAVSACIEQRRGLISSAVVAALLSSGCGMFEFSGQEYGDEAGDEYYTPSSASSPAPSTYSTPSNSTPASPSTQQPSNNQAQGSDDSDSGSPSAESSGSGQSCLSFCEDEENVARETASCLNTAGQGPCYCSSALTMLCFLMAGCYAEAGANTSLTEEDLALAMGIETLNSANVGYSCKFVADDGTLDLTETIFPGVVAQNQGDSFEPDAELPPQAGAQMPAPTPSDAACNPCVDSSCSGTCESFSAR